MVRPHLKKTAVLVMSDRAIPMMPTHRRAGEHDGRAAQQRLFGGGVPGVLRHLG